MREKNAKYFVMAKLHFATFYVSSYRDISTNFSCKNERTHFLYILSVRTLES